MYSCVDCWVLDLLDYRLTPIFAEKISGKTFAEFHKLAACLLACLVVDWLLI